VRKRECYWHQIIEYVSPLKKVLTELVTQEAHQLRTGSQDNLQNWGCPEVAMKSTICKRVTLNNFFDDAME
jgi:hypothetical protein